MKAQMRFQKTLTLVTLIVAALTFVYAICFMTGSLSYLADWSYVKQQTSVSPLGSGVDSFYDMAQMCNNTLFILSIVFILVTATLYITASNRRRNYYITNYISVIAVAAFAIIFSLIAIIFISLTLNEFLNSVDWETYQYYHSIVIPGTDALLYPNYSESTAVFVVGYAMFVLVLITAAAHIVNLIWKIKLMKGEKALLAGGLVKEVA